MRKLQTHVYDSCHTTGGQDQTIWIPKAPKARPVSSLFADTTKMVCSSSCDTTSERWSTPTNAAFQVANGT